MPYSKTDDEFFELDRWVNDAVVHPLLQRDTTPEHGRAATLRPFRKAETSPACFPADRTMDVDTLRPAFRFFIRFQLGESIQALSEETGVPADRIEHRIRAVFRLMLTNTDFKEGIPATQAGV